MCTSAEALANSEAAPFVCAPVTAHGKPALRFRCAPDAAASTASHPNVRDDHDTPLVGDETAGVLELIWVRREGKYSWGRGLDR